MLSGVEHMISHKTSPNSTSILEESLIEIVKSEEQRKNNGKWTLFRNIGSH